MSPPMVKVDGPAEGPSLWLTGFAFMASWLVRTWPWLPGRVTIPDDAKAHFLPQVQFLAHSLWQSERPFWTSFVFSDHRQIAAAAELILVLAKRLCPVVPYLAAALATHNDKMLSRDGFPDIDSGGTVLLETPPHYVLTVTATGSAIRAYRNDEVVIEASSDGGWLVLNDVWPGCLQMWTGKQLPSCARMSYFARLRCRRAATLYGSGSARCEGRWTN